MKIDLEKHDLGPPCPNPEHHVLGLTWRYTKGKPRCVKCVVDKRRRLRKQTRSRDAEYYAANRERRKADTAAWRAANPEKVKERCAAHYAANRKTLLQKHAEWRAANHEKRKAYQAAYYAANREALRQANAEWRAANPEKRKERYAADYANKREILLLRNAEWRAANPEKVRAALKAWRERNLEKLAAYNANNKDKTNARAAKRRAAKLQRTPPWADLKDIAGFYQTANWLGLHVDHIVPLQGKLVSGLHVSNNLRMIPAEDNIRKHAKFDPWTHVHELPSPQPA